MGGKKTPVELRVSSFNQAGEVGAGGREWTADDNRRRCELIDRKYDHGLDPAEEAELAVLQDAMQRHIDRLGVGQVVQVGYMRRYDGGYGYAERDGLKLHLRASPEIEPFSNHAEVWVETADPDPLHSSWNR